MTITASETLDLTPTAMRVANFVRRLQGVHRMRNQYCATAPSKIAEIGQNGGEPDVPGLLADAAPFRENRYQSLHKSFEVMVLGTLKAGKSTLLNALLGRNLLPTAADASTAIHYRIEDCDDIDKFRCRAVLGEDAGDWQDATPETLQQWNTSGFCSRVEMQGSIPAVRNAVGRLVLHDTPGPNNAVDKRHGDVTRNVLQNQHYDLVLYMLATEHAHCDSELVLLTALKDALRAHSARQRTTVLFVLNKVDQFDEERHESLKEFLCKQKAFLSNAGFPNANIIPVMALNALLIRMTTTAQPLTRMQSGHLRNKIALLRYRSTSLLSDTDCSDAIRDRIQSQCRYASQAQNLNLTYALLTTGIPTLEAHLSECLYLKALPDTIAQLKRVLRSNDAQQLLEWLKQ